MPMTALLSGVFAAHVARNLLSGVATTQLELPVVKCEELITAMPSLPKCVSAAPELSAFIRDEILMMFCPSQRIVYFSVMVLLCARSS